MKAVLLTSSALILALLVLRRLFRRTLSRRVQYALWGLVLLRLLVPVSLPAAGFSLLTAAEPVVEDLEALYLEPQSVTAWGRDGGPVMGVPNPFPAAVGPATPDNSHAFSYRDAMKNPAAGVGTYKRQILLEDLLSPVWHGGMAVMACWLLFSNLRFWRKLRKHRKPYAAEGARFPVYLVESGLPSPCLFGLFRPAVYLTPAALASPDSLRHVLAHEETHARHFDPLWALLRGVCLMVYWFDPLVWWAALASRTDCELACDEGAIRLLGEEERIPYGRTLLSLIPVRRVPADPFLAATTMTSDKRRLMDRVTRIAENRQGLGTALFAVIALAALICAVTFTEAKVKAEEERYDTVEEAVAALAEEFSASDDFFPGLKDYMVYTSENPPMHFDLNEGELLRVYYGTYIGLSSNLQNPLGWLCSLYRVDNLDYFGNIDWAQEVIGTDGTHFYVLARAAWAPEMKAGMTEGAALMNRAADRIREAVLACRDVQRAAALPDWEPLIKIPLESLEPYEPEAVEYMSEDDTGSLTMLGGLEDPDGILGDFALVFFQDGRGRVYAGVQSAVLSSYPAPFWSFNPGAGGRYSASCFRGLMGHDGFCITYENYQWPEGSRPSINEYYYLNKDGRPVLLARAEGNPSRIDLDGDGERELVTQGWQSGEFWFRRDGKYYHVVLDEVLADFWPKPNSFVYENWVDRGLCFRANWSTPLYNQLRPSYEYRTLYFDGESLLVYNDQRHFANHMIDDFDIDRSIIAAGMDAVKQAFKAAGPDYDDWRITAFVGAEVLDVNGQSYLVRKIAYEFHALQPQDVPGQSAKDRWIDPCYPEETYLVFRADRYDEAAESRVSDITYLFSMRQEGWPTRDQLQERLGLETTSPAADVVRAALGSIMGSHAVTIAYEQGESYEVDPRIWNDRAADFLNYYDWSYAGDPGEAPVESYLLTDGVNSFRFWPDVDVVLLQTAQGDAWLQGTPASATPPAFWLVGTWYNIAAGQSLPIHEMLRGVLAGDFATFTYNNYESSETRTANPGQLEQTEAIIEDYTWSFSPDSYSRSPVTLELASQDGQVSFTFSPGNNLVKLRRGEESFWFLALSNTGFIVGDSFIYDLVYGWFESVS